VWNIVSLISTGASLTLGIFFATKYCRFLKQPGTYQVYNTFANISWSLFCKDQYVAICPLRVPNLETATPQQYLREVTIGWKIIVWFVNYCLSIIHYVSPHRDYRITGSFSLITFRSCSYLEVEKLRFLMYSRVAPVLRIRIRDPVLFYPPDPGSGSGIRDGAMVGSGSGIRDKTSRIRNTEWHNTDFIILVIAPVYSNQELPVVFITLFSSMHMCPVS
jgi:hypothetical protein